MTDNKGRIIFFAIIYTITAICVLFGCYAVYNIAFVEKPWTLGVTYIDKLEYSEDQQSVATVSVKHNVNNNGASLYEILFNGYTDTEGNYVEGFGIQCLGDFTVYNTYYGTCFSSDGQTITEQDVFNNSSNYSRIGQSTVYLGDFSYYHTGDNGLTYSKLPTNEIPTEIIIDINGDSP